MKYLKLNNKLDFFFTSLDASVPSWNLSNDRRNQSALIFKKQLKEYLIEKFSYDKKYPTDKNIIICINFFFKSRKKEFAVKDLDNHIKHIIDAMEGIIYKNDSQIVALLVIKELSKESPSMYGVSGRIIEKGNEAEKLIKNWWTLLKER